MRARPRPWAPGAVPTGRVERAPPGGGRWAGE